MFALHAIKEIFFESAFGQMLIRWTSAVKNASSKVRYSKEKDGWQCLLEEK